MKSEDADYGRNPFSLVRTLRNECRFCPVCRKECTFEVDFDRDSEILHLVADCGSCGKTGLVPNFGKDGDLSIYIEDSDDTYEPDQKCFELKEKLGDRAVPGACKEDLELFSLLADGYSITCRPSAAAEMYVGIAEEYRGHIGDDDWDDAFSNCSNVAVYGCDLLSSLNRQERALELLKEYLPLAEEDKTYAGFQIRTLYGELLVNSDIDGALAYLRKLIDELESMEKGSAGPFALYEFLYRAEKQIGIIFSSTNKYEKSSKYLKKAYETAQLMVESDISKQSLMTLADASFGYSCDCFVIGKPKRGIEAVKTCVKICSRYKSEFPVSYAAAVECRVKFFLSTEMEFLPSFKSELTEAIEILKGCEDDDRYAHLISCYFLRSTMNKSDEEISKEDVDEGFHIMCEGLSAGKIPESLVTSSMSLFITYLETKKDPRAEVMRRKLTDLGIWMMPSLTQMMSCM